MNDQNQIGAGLAPIFAIIGFIIALYDIFSVHSGVLVQLALGGLGYLLFLH